MCAKKEIIIIKINNHEYSMPDLEYAVNFLKRLKDKKDAEDT